MEMTNLGSEAHDILTDEEKMECHKARIFSVLIKAPVVRAWRNAICDGAVFLTNDSFPNSYADRYFQTSRYDISYVAFSIVTVFKEMIVNDEGRQIPHARCPTTTPQREASEFLIVTFSDKHDRLAILPHRLYWPLKEDGSDTLSASTIYDYSFPANCLLANIEEIRRMSARPMHPTTTPFRFGLDGNIPKADFPDAIMPPESEEHPESLIEEALRTFHRNFSFHKKMKIDFLYYQPLLGDFKIVFSNIESSDNVPSDFEAVIGFHLGKYKNPDYTGSSDYLRDADYILSNGFLRSPEFEPDHVFFIPRRLIVESWFLTPRPGNRMPTDMELYDFDRPIDRLEFLFGLDDAGVWVKHIWNIINKYPPTERPTTAEKKQEKWRKAVPWSGLEVQTSPQEDTTLQSAQGETGQASSKRDSGTGQAPSKRGLGTGQASSKRDSGTGETSAVKPDDVSLLAAHYMKKISGKENIAEEDTA